MESALALQDGWSRGPAFILAAGGLCNTRRVPYDARERARGLLVLVYLLEANSCVSAF
jgi:hypothetical protein